MTELLEQMSELHILLKYNTGMKKSLKIPTGVIRIRISKNRQYIKSKGINQPENVIGNGSSRHDDAAQTK